MSHLRIAKELIAYQTDGFKDRLIALFEELYKESTPYEAQASKTHAEIEAQLFKRFGLKIVFTVDTEDPPMTIPVMANPNHVLSILQKAGLYHEQESSFIKALNNAPKVTGTVDLKNAKVGGAYSKIDMPIMFSFSFMRLTFSPAEAVAILLHEVGHCFLAFEFMFRTYRASQLLAALHQVKTGRDSSLRYEFAVQGVAERLTKEGFIESPKELEALVAVKNDAVTVSVVYTRVWSKLANDFGSNPATAPNFEALSDNFSLRFGMGKELASGLAKLLVLRPEGFMSSLLYIVSSFSLAGAFGSVLVSLTGAVLMGVVGVAVICALSFFLGGYSDIGFSQTAVYDNDVERIQRIQRGVVTALKNPKLDSKSRQSLTAQALEIDKMVKGKADVSTVWDDLANIAFTSRRDAKAVFKLERDIEALASSNLFVGASLLKNAA